MLAQLVGEHLVGRLLQTFREHELVVLLRRHRLLVAAARHQVRFRAALDQILHSWYIPERRPVLKTFPAGVAVEVGTIRRALAAEVDPVRVAVLEALDREQRELVVPLQIRDLLGRQAGHSVENLLLVAQTPPTAMREAAAWRRREQDGLAWLGLLHARLELRADAQHRKVAVHLIVLRIRDNDFRRRIARQRALFDAVDDEVAAAEGQEHGHAAAVGRRGPDRRQRDRRAVVRTLCQHAVSRRIRSLQIDQLVLP